LVFLRQVPPKRRFLQEPHGVTTQKTPFFIVTAVKTSNLTSNLFQSPGEVRETPTLLGPLERANLSQWSRVCVSFSTSQDENKCSFQRLRFLVI
jgi:hypothetical protein